MDPAHTIRDALNTVSVLRENAAALTCPQTPYQSKFQKSGVCKIN